MLASAATTIASCTLVWALACNRVLVSPADALAASIQDDSFYYILPAHHFPANGFFSFDGRAQTYGFQPLYMLVLSAVAFAIRELPALLRAALLINVTLYCATAILIYCTVAISLSRAAPPLRAGAALIGAHLFLCNIGVFLANMTAKENALAGFLLGCSVLICVRTRGAAVRTSAIPAITLGLFCGLLVLCRLLPSTLLSVALLLCASRLSARNRALAIAACILPLAAWATYAGTAFGSFIPTSAAVKGSSLRATATALGDSVARPQVLAAATGFVSRSLRLATGGEHGFWMPQADAWEIGAGGGPHSSALFRAGMNAALLAAIGVVALLGLPTVRSVTAGWMLLGLFLLNVAGLAVSGALMHRRSEDAIFYCSWYVYDLPISLCVLLPVLIVSAGRQHLPRWLAALPDTSRLAHPFACAGLFASCLICLACAISVFRHLQPLPQLTLQRDNWAAMMIHCGHVLRDELGLLPHQRVAAFSSGALGFVLDGRVTNLDGLANDEVLAFQAAGGSIQQYLERSDLHYYVDVVEPSKLGIRATILRAEPFLQRDLPFYYIARIEPASTP